MAYTVWESSVYFADGEIPGPLGSAHRVSAPYQALRTKDGYLNIGAATQPTWEQLCRAAQPPCGSLALAVVNKSPASRAAPTASRWPTLNRLTASKVDNNRSSRSIGLAVIMSWPGPVHRPISSSRSSKISYQVRA